MAHRGIGERKIKLRHKILYVMKSLSNAIRRSKIVQRIRHKIHYFKLMQLFTLLKIKKKGSANVVFFAVNRPMWRFQHLYELLEKDRRFNVIVVVSSFDSYTKKETEKYQTELICYFRKNNVKYILQEDLPKNMRIKSLEPDILLYTQPYDTFGYNASYKYFKNKLLIYIPYCVNISFLDWIYNTNYQNIAWRCYLPTKIHLENAKKLSIIKGRNVRVVGEPNADEYLSITNGTVWKNRDKKKRIIYAPHFQIITNKMFNRPSFMWTGEYMLDLANKYSDRVQFAFKPHPRLFSELCKHPDWGEAKARDYYKKWETMSNTQLESGDFINLFMKSDALIHDCGSFTAEYQFTKKPCMFLTRDIESVKNILCPFGVKCYENHYIGSTYDDITDFIEKVVFKGDDPKLLQREQFFNDYLQPPNGGTTAENIYNDLVTSLFGE